MLDNLVRMKKKQVKNYDDLSEVIDNNGGVITIEMRDLRDIHGASKLGTTIVLHISEALDHRGLSHYPDPLPVHQDYKARIYKRSSPVGELIKAVLDVDDEKSDDVLRGIASNSAGAILKKIKELVCD